MPDTISVDRMVLALISVVRTLVLELSEKGLLEVQDFVIKLQQVADAHRGRFASRRMLRAAHSSVSPMLHTAFAILIWRRSYRCFRSFSAHAASHSSAAVRSLSNACR
jgi:hypothetical protein